MEIFVFLGTIEAAVKRLGRPAVPLLWILDSGPLDDPIFSSFFPTTFYSH
jgi:hypothetical protein